MSGRQTGEGGGAASKKTGKTRKVSPNDSRSRKQRASDVGRALRSIYDDTVREPVPGDFLDLLGKLS